MAGYRDQLIGRTVGGCRVLDVLGEGGMGVVYRAVQERLDAPVALKLLHLARRGHEAAVKRFEREARQIARLRGKTPNVVQIYDFGWDDSLGAYYIAMEYVSGCSGEQLLRLHTRVPQVVAAEIVRQTASALEIARRDEVVHRDIKPDNLLVTTSGLVKVTDFGLAKGHDSDSNVTASGQVVGTPAYMSPEQCDGEKADHRSDIYSLGATLYALLAGEPPFTSETPMGMLVQHMRSPVPDPRERGGDVTDGLFGLIESMMAKKPGDRPATAGDVADQLATLIDDMGAAQPPQQLLAELIPEPTEPDPPPPSTDSELSAIAVASTKIEPQSEVGPAFVSPTPPDVEPVGSGPTDATILVSDGATPPPDAAELAESERGLVMAQRRAAVAREAGLSKARQALNEGAWADAWQSLSIAARQDPSDPQVLELREELEKRWREVPVGPDGGRPAFVYIEPGTFQMGDVKGEPDETPHAVTLTTGFWMQITPVTQAQYAAVMGLHPSQFDGGNHPVESVDWDHAELYCERLTQYVAPLRAGLPTEAEWEYACRAGTTTRWWFGDDAARLGEHAWFADNAGPRTRPVADRPANPWGLCDMHGNVWEWCADWYGPYPREATDPEGPLRGRVRVVRGGAWDSDSNVLRSANRWNRKPGGATNAIGFRVVLRG